MANITAYLLDQIGYESEGEILEATKAHESTILGDLHSEFLSALWKVQSAKRDVQGALQKLTNATARETKSFAENGRTDATFTTQHALRFAEASAELERQIETARRFAKLIKKYAGDLA